MRGPLVLGIETSCDETAIGIVAGRTLLANVNNRHLNQYAYANPLNAILKF